MAKSDISQKKIMKVVLNPVCEEIDGVLTFLPKIGDTIVIEYPDSWPIEQKRLSGVLDYIGNDGNFYVYVESFFYKIGLNYKTARNHGIKIFREERVEWIKTQQSK